MKIAVCVKHVPCGTLRLRPDGNALDRDGPGELNATDKNAIEEALRQQEALRLEEGGDSEVVLVTMGPAAATESLRTGLGMGADRAVLVDDESVSGSDLVATSRVLAGVLARESADLVLFGQQTHDGGGAVLWAAVAERLQVPFVSQANKLTVGDGTVVIERETEVGTDTIEAALPAVIAVSDAINEPRYTSLKGMMAAKKKPLDTLTATDLALSADAVGSAGSQTVVLGLGAPPTRAGAVTIEDDGAAAQSIFDYLKERELA
jgi:electron transfer flavoprotein beta subunit